MNKEKNKEDKKNTDTKKEVKKEKSVTPKPKQIAISKVNKKNQILITIKKI